MGILDDAIREHLELKRAHGASDAEVRAQEAEALGAARQAAAAEAEADGAAVAQADGAALAEAESTTAADEHAAAPGLADLEPLEPAPEDPYEVHPGDSLVPDPDVAPALPHDRHDDEPHPALVDHDHIGGEEHAPEPVFGHVDEPAATAEPAATEEPAGMDLDTEEHDAFADDEPAEEPGPAAETGEEDEDVLEETPEFLQDAPEHDRLWFEQRPPRDFDFGE